MIECLAGLGRISCRHRGRICGRNVRLIPGGPGAFDARNQPPAPDRAARRSPGGVDGRPATTDATTFPWLPPRPGVRPRQGKEGSPGDSCTYCVAQPRRLAGSACWRSYALASTRVVRLVMVLSSSLSRTCDLHSVSLCCAIASAAKQRPPLTLRRPPRWALRSVGCVCRPPTQLQGLAPRPGCNMVVDGRGGRGHRNRPAWAARAANGQRSPVLECCGSRQRCRPFSVPIPRDLTRSRCLHLQLSKLQALQSWQDCCL